MKPDEPTNSRTIREVAEVFLKLGATGFGGPVAAIAMMDEEVVHRRKWLSRERFMDLVGATNLIPGPNSTEMAIHLGFLRAGWLGLLTGGICFIGPAAIISTLFAWAYMRYGALPQVAPFVMGAQPAVLAVIASALWRLGKTACKTRTLLCIALLSVVATACGLNEIVTLFAVGIAGAAWLRWRSGKSGPGNAIKTGVVLSAVSWKPRMAVAATSAAGATAAGAAAPFALWKLGLFFLKVGAVLYGSGYVLLAFLEGGLVKETGWLTRQQLLDAIAVGQFTPGPLLSSAAFVGYVLAGWAGAAVSIICINIPSFLFVALLSPMVDKLRKSAITSAFLDSINASALGLMAVVTFKLGRETLVHWPAIVIALTSCVVAFRTKLNPAWLVLGGAVAGWILSFLSERI